MINTKLFVAHLTLRHGEYETSVKRLILATSIDAAEFYAYDEGMPTFESDDREFYQESDQPHTWYYAGGEWSATLCGVTEVEDKTQADAIVNTGLISFL